MKNSGSFKKGHKTWNKGLKGIHLHPETEFKAGENVGADNASWKGGVQYSKRDGTILNTGCNTRSRRARVVYEKAHGKIPKGFVIIHLDWDKDNDNVKNLKAISRSDNLKRNLGERK